MKHVIDYEDVGIDGAFSKILEIASYNDGVVESASFPKKYRLLISWLRKDLDEFKKTNISIFEDADYILVNDSELEILNYPASFYGVEQWDYKMPKFEGGLITQKDWNQTITSALNRLIMKSVDGSVLFVPINMKPLFESLEYYMDGMIFSKPVTFEGISNIITYGEEKLEILNAPK